MAKTALITSATTCEQRPGHAVIPLEIVIDTREQNPWEFSLPVIRACLASGDYSLTGFESEISIERKSLGDLVQSLTWERQRFERELARLSEYQRACVIVEGSLSDVHAQKYRSQAHPSAVVGSTVALFLDYNVPFFFCSTRLLASDYCERILMKFYKRAAGSRAELQKG